MEFVEFSGKNVEAALQEAAAHFQTSVEELEVEVVEEGSKGILGFGQKPAVIKAKKKFSLTGTAEEFLHDVLKTMNMDVQLITSYNEEEATISIDLNGDDMGILIGKRGQTLDSLQYLTSLVVNKYTEDYVRVKLDIENYRERRKETLETLAHNIANKVKRSRRPVSLEPMNPYERRIIHSTLQNDKYVVTSSEGEDPYRHVVISMKKERSYDGERRGGYRKNYGGGNRGRGGYNRDYRGGNRGSYRDRSYNSYGSYDTRTEDNSQQNENSGEE